MLEINSKVTLDPNLKDLVDWTRLQIDCTVTLLTNLELWEKWNKNYNSHSLSSSQEPTRVVFSPDSRHWETRWSLTSTHWLLNVTRSLLMLILKEDTSIILKKPFSSILIFWISRIIELKSYFWSELIKTICKWIYYKLVDI